MLSVYFDDAEWHTIYDYLKKFGMYKPGKTSKKTFESLKADRIWGETERIFEKYRKKWAGPDIPIFIFPLDKSNFQLVREGKGKSGVSFKDKIFLFLTPLEDAKELEALFVHEYHHACRMKGQKKDPGEYTLLDSMILEGLAEHAVAVNCGRDYTGEWSRRYTKEDLSAYWNEDLKEQLTIKRNHHLHDEILFGLGRWPKLLGYAIGYEIVKQYKQRENFSEKASFTLSSANFTKLLNF